MIKKIALHNFKIHKNLDLQLGNLTLLCGANGMGKSSLIQSMLLLRQSFNGQTALNGIHLSGPLYKIGTQRDLICQNTEDNKLSINISCDNEQLDFIFPFERIVNYDNFMEISQDNPKFEDMVKCSLFTDDFQYISAFRFGPLASYHRETDGVQNHKQISQEEGKCEYAVHFLHYWGNKIECLPELLFDKNNGNNKLKEQVELWLQAISPEIKIDIKQDGPDFKLNYRFASFDAGLQTDNISAVNVGFGVTYALPILVAILSAKPGALILIENPEAHLHPGAISALMDLICKAVKTGIQIIIETHSDHVINGMLVKVAQENNMRLDGEEVECPLVKDITQVHFFRRNNENHTSVVDTLEVLEDGRIVAKRLENGHCMKLPDGFFDQIDKDLERIVGF